MLWGDLVLPDKNITQLFPNYWKQGIIIGIGRFLRDLEFVKKDLIDFQELVKGVSD